jgi:hypothetical protein
MRTQLANRIAEIPPSDIDPRMDRYGVERISDGPATAFIVRDKQRANAVVGTYATFKQASLESAFLSLMHLKYLRALKQ